MSELKGELIAQTTEKCSLGTACLKAVFLCSKYYRLSSDAIYVQISFSELFQWLKLMSSSFARKKKGFGGHQAT